MGEGRCGAAFQRGRGGGRQSLAHSPRWESTCRNPRSAKVTRKRPITSSTEGTEEPGKGGRWGVPEMDIKTPPSP